LYKPLDHKDLAAKIKYLLEHPHQAQEMGRNGRRWALRTFTRKNYLRNLSKVLEQI
jgi:spore maturation protein CgeB